MTVIDPTHAREETIALQTRRKNDIRNSQSFEMGNLGARSSQVLAEYARATGATQRTTKFSLIYNCHGLTFASRRTSIHEDSEVLRILFQDDGYEEIDVQNVLEGDVALYRGPRGTVPHTAVVVSRPTAAELWMPMVVSKFGHTCEFIHRANMLPRGLEYDSLTFHRVVE